MSVSFVPFVALIAHPFDGLDGVFHLEEMPVGREHRNGSVVPASAAGLECRDTIYRIERCTNFVALLRSTNAAKILAILHASVRRSANSLAKRQYRQLTQ